MKTKTIYGTFGFFVFQAFNFQRLGRLKLTSIKSAPYYNRNCPTKMAVQRANNFFSLWVNSYDFFWIFQIWNYLLVFLFFPIFQTLIAYISEVGM